LGRVDLLVEQGFYSTRTDFIRTAIRNQLETHHTEIRETIARRALVMGVLVYGQSDLEDFIEKNQQLDVRVLGLFALENDVTAEVAKKAIVSLKVFGVFKASKAVKDALADRIL
jgi:Arc/MetJ-type ribon-helix-helix transcriptional regulator